LPFRFYSFSGFGTSLRYESFVITLDPQGARFAAFRKDNPYLRCHVAQGIRGAEIARDARLVQGLVTAQCLDRGAVSDGEVGCAASHRILWRESARLNVPMLILEDDVITHPALAEVITRIDFSFDIIFFGVNTDTLLCTLSPEGVREFSSFADRYPPPDRIKQILAQTQSSPLVYRRLLNGFGMCCYLVSHEGAAKIAQRIFPLRLDQVPIEGMPKAIISGTSIDRRLNALFAELRCFVARPFLAWTPNTDSSTR